MIIILLLARQLPFYLPTTIIPRYYQSSPQWPALCIVFYTKGHGQEAVSWQERI
ncbi:MAG: hypothetical protein NZ901_02135 [Geminocystis sp.]|nr:hypothetical protein [Geminocystis sp.]MCS7146969.1 hypothetical protein [Geminocystis sp.]MCX8077281.1 hypothetical protein [Geminocystis sp.]MDW8115793.1 hypothetical protein [Geminocystis sp.]MDW8463336.1 hypothetical protein [Geminocystis sp.]